MVLKQDNKCAICVKEETRKSRNSQETDSLCIDHFHTTGKVRALLCHSCNTALGKVNESKKILQNLMDYISIHNDEPEVST